MAFNINYNGIDLNETSVFIPNTMQGVDGLDLRKTLDNLTGGDGGNMWSSFYNARLIRIEGSLFAVDQADYFIRKSQLVNAFTRSNQSRILTIERWDGTIRIANAKVYTTPQFTDRGGNLDYNTFSVELIVEDGFFYDTVLQTATVLPSQFGGTPVPTPVNFPVGNIISSSDIINSTSIDAFAIFTINGSITNASVRNTTTGRQFNINTQILNGQSVIVQTDQRGDSITMGSQNYYQFFVGSIFPIVSGTNNIVINGSSFDSSANLQISFRNRYLSL